MANLSNCKLKTTISKLISECRLHFNYNGKTVFYIRFVIGNRRLFGAMLVCMFSCNWLLGGASSVYSQDTLRLLNALDSSCQVHLKERNLDSLWFVAAELKGLASAWLKSKPGDRQGSYYLMAGFLHQSNVFNLQSRNKEAIQGYEQALTLSLQIGDSVKRHSIYNNIGILFFNLGQFSKALHFHKRALLERIRMQDSVLVGDSYNSLGLIFLEWKKFKEAGWLFKQELRYRRFRQTPVQKTAETLNNLGRVYSNNGDWILGTLCYGMAFRLFSEAENKLGQVYILNNVSVVLRNFGFLKHAEDLLKVALVLLPDKESIVWGDLHLNLGVICLENRQMAKALGCFTQSQKTYLRLENAHKLAILNRTLGDFYIKNHQFLLAKKALRAALSYYEANQAVATVCSVLQEYAATFQPTHSDSTVYFLLRSLNMSRREGLGYESALALLKLGTFYLKEGSLTKASFYFEQCLNTHETPASVSTLQEARRGLISCYESTGKWGEAENLNTKWSFQNELIRKKSDTVKDRLHRLVLIQNKLLVSVGNAHAMGDLRRSFEESKRLNLFVLLGVLLALALTIILALLIYIRKREQEGIRLKLESDLMGLKGMINQHFIANTMNAIKSLINQGKTDVADVYLNKFSALLRGALSQSKNILISLDEELRFIRLYVDLEQFRFPGQINFDLAVDPSLDLEKAMVPPMLLHPIFENSIQHGRRGCDLPLHISLTVFPQANRLVFLIQDDGIGVNADKTENKAKLKTSFGIDLTEQRIKLIGYQYKVQVDFSVDEVLDSKGLPSGTRVILQVPFTVAPNI